MTVPRAGRVLVVGWPSFLHGEAAAGDVLAMDAVRRAPLAAGIPCGLAWSPVFRPGARTLEDAPPGAHTTSCSPVGPRMAGRAERLHQRYRSCCVDNPQRTG
jgi:hypothetical protein